MSDTSLRVVEVAYDPDGLPVVHIDGWGPLQTPLMQSAPAGGLETYMVTGGIGSTTLDGVRADIQARVAAGQTPVLKSHLDDLGITAAVEAWATS